MCAMDWWPLVVRCRACQVEDQQGEDLWGRPRPTLGSCVGNMVDYPLLQTMRSHWHNPSFQWLSMKITRENTRIYLHTNDDYFLYKTFIFHQHPATLNRQDWTEKIHERAICKGNMCFALITHQNLTFFYLWDINESRPKNLLNSAFSYYKLQNGYSQQLTLRPTVYRCYN